MLAKIVCVMMITTGAFASDELLETLYGATGRNRVSLCVRHDSTGRIRRCDAALLTREWALARAGCVRTADTEHITTLRHPQHLSCQLLAQGYSFHESRKARAHMMHPWFDLALVIVHRPYNYLEKFPNNTAIREMLRLHGVLPWMTPYLREYALTRDVHYQMELIGRSLKSYHHPIWLFFVTILLPFVSFILFFIYFIFYTGGSNTISYKKLHYSKKISQV